MPDDACTFWPAVWLGVSLTPCCIAHDLSPLDTGSSLDLAVCVFDRLAGTHPVVGAVLGGLMALGTPIRCGVKYGPRGKR